MSRSTETLFFFGPDGAALFGALHAPPAAATRGIVVCAPLGIDNVTSYRPLRALAARLAATGAGPVLRFDWPATGDSHGSQDDPSLVDAYVGSVARAVAELAARTGVERVTLLAVGIGATLAAVAAARDEAVDELVLWAPYAAGRAYVRELRAFHAFSGLHQADASARPSNLPEGALEAAGFYLSPETAAGLRALDLDGVDLEGAGIARALVLGRDGREPDTRLAARLGADTAAGDGLATLLTDTTKLPHKAFDTIATWLGAGAESETALGAAGIAASAAAASPGHGVREELVTVDVGGARIAGVVARPAGAGAGERWVVFFTTGSVRRSGPSRMWTRLARAWASQGISSLRVDTWGVGDSSGPLVATPSLSTLYADEVHRCYDVLLGWLHDTYRPRHVAAVGLCSGSFMAYRATVRHASVRLAMLVNLPRFDWRPTDEAEVILGSLRGRRLTHEWRRLATGDLEVRRPLAALARAARAKARSWLGGGAGLPAAAAAGVHGVSRRGGRLVFVYSSEDPSLAYADSIFPGGVAALAATRGVRVEEVSGAGHTFMPAWAQDRLTEILTRELTAEPPETEPESGQVGGAPLPAPAR